ncbi:MAG: hypothetical protein WC796_00415 [Candidatus Pacearchaeota archaeon]|jgi:hypothetical protein
MNNKKIVASFIIEILGRPPEYVKETLIGIVDKIDKEKGVSITEKRIHEPRRVEGDSDLYTTFAEIEAEFETLENMLTVAFNYMPSNFEIISPTELIIKNVEISNILTSILIRLHKYEEIVKKVGVDNAVLQRRLKELVDYLQQKKGVDVSSISGKELTKEKKKNPKKAGKKKI